VATVAGKPDRETLDRIAAAAQKDVIDQALTAARERLNMDAVYLTTVTSEVQQIDAMSGDSGALGLGVGDAIPIEDTYCNRMLAGVIPQLVTDTKTEPRIADLALTKRIGAYVGVPITLRDGRIHGTLCASCSQPRTELGDEELRFMHVLADIVAERIDESKLPPRGGLR
jgi:GAF domain-containing protein